MNQKTVNTATNKTKSSAKKRKKNPQLISRKLHCTLQLKKLLTFKTIWNCSIQFHISYWIYEINVIIFDLLTCCVVYCRFEFSSEFYEYYSQKLLNNAHTKKPDSLVRIKETLFLNLFELYFILEMKIVHIDSIKNQIQSFLRRKFNYSWKVMRRRSWKIAKEDSAIFQDSFLKLINPKLVRKSIFWGRKWISDFFFSNEKSIQIGDFDILAYFWQLFFFSNF